MIDPWINGLFVPFSRHVPYGLFTRHAVDFLLRKGTIRLGELEIGLPSRAAAIKSAEAAVDEAKKVLQEAALVPHLRSNFLLSFFRITVQRELSGELIAVTRCSCNPGGLYMS